VLFNVTQACYKCDLTLYTGKCYCHRFDIVNLSVTVLGCRRFFLSPLSCRHFDLSPFWLVLVDDLKE